MLFYPTAIMLNRQNNNNTTTQSSNIKHADVDPTISENLPQGTIWVNDETGKLFICSDNTKDNNVWTSCKFDIAIAPTTTNIVDFFGDGSGVALYQFNGNGNDTGGVCNSEDINVTYDVGKFDQAGQFNGSNSYVKIKAADLPNVTNVITITGWFKLNSASGYRILFNLGGYLAELQYSGSTLQVAYGNSWSWNNVKSVSNYNQFNFIALSYDKNSGNVRVYLNGELVYSGKKASSYQFGNPKGLIGIGARLDYSDGKPRSYFSGAIDQVRLFNKELTLDEIKQLYAEK